LRYDHEKELIFKRFVPFVSDPEHREKVRSLPLSFHCVLAHSSS
jgi:hypothetical protein